MKPIQTNAIISSISSKVDRSLGLRVQLPELQPAEKALFFELQGTNIKLLITPEDTEPSTPAYVVNKDLETKTPSERLRGVLFRTWELEGQDKTFEEYYKLKMEKIIEHFKEKLV